MFRNFNEWIEIFKPRRLHIFSNEVPDWVIAYDPADVVKVWEETTGEKYVPDENGGEFTQDSDFQETVMYEEDLIKPEPVPAHAVVVERGDYWQKTRATNRAWADARGRCFLGSAEY